MDMKEKLAHLIVSDLPEKDQQENARAAKKLADHLIANGVTVQEWISVKDRLPFAEYGESDDVLAITELGVMRTLYFNGGNWCFQNGECCPHKVTHWMPLPQLPKGE